MRNSEEDAGVQVIARSHETPDKLIRRFMKKVRNEGLLQEVWDKQRFEKPSVKRRKKSAKARWANRQV